MTDFPDRSEKLKRHGSYLHEIVREAFHGTSNALSKIASTRDGIPEVLCFHLL